MTTKNKFNNMCVTRQNVLISDGIDLMIYDKNMQL